MDITYKTNKKILKGRKKKGGKLGNLENKEPYGEFPGLSFPPHIPDWVLQNPQNANDTEPKNKAPKTICSPLPMGQERDS